MLASFSVPLGVRDGVKALVAEALRIVDVSDLDYAPGRCLQPWRAIPKP